MKNPRIVVNLEKLEKNIAFIAAKLAASELSITAVTKVFEAHPEMIAVYDKFPEIDYFGDSRIENLISYQASPKKKILIRIPMQSEAEEIVRYADISFNSELETVKCLNQAAKEQNKIHEIVLMVDLGDLREGYFDQQELLADTAEIMKLSNIWIKGLSVNLTCYGAIIPNHQNLGQLVELKKQLQQKYNLTLEMVSGGNSSSLYLLDSSTDYLPEGINNLRIGETFVLGRETAYGETYPQMHQNVFTLKAELVELKTKPSYPIGEIGVDAFGNRPEYVDKGNMKRGVAAIGRQDVNPDDITPLDERIEILGASSDHLILDMSNTGDDYQVGKEVEFSLSYGSLLSSFTSRYVKKEFIR
ncbi:alanine/ornithine racemase family PLP-dependent enzyme [Enterococcus sp. 669A]|uniref:Alanine/ornithine racemase family PLP-dependent enzyme n=1 Tax=Candidatus Enterococcus moelleringii TaxID=2815325 RepID=A0ABS3LB76_9ENTE|nr:alanine/ornithine racemase family PLP-dependent enzyme [Enterococcus sp. 669A]